jgi:hypothetical protein
MDPTRHFKECQHRAEHPTPNPNTIYVAGSSRDRILVRDYMAELRLCGYTVTHDWTSDNLHDMAPELRTDAMLTKSAGLDLDAVRAAAVLWYVACPHKSEGSHGELCAALVLGKQVVVSGPLDVERLFPRLAQHRYRQHSEALEFLRERARAHARDVAGAAP